MRENECESVEKTQLCNVSVIIYWMMLALDSLIFIFTLICLVIELRQKSGKMTRLVKLLLPVVPLLRILNFLYVGRYYFYSGGAYSAYQNLFEIITGGLPGYLTISILTILVILWGLLYSTAFSSSSEIVFTMIKVSIVMNIGMYCVWILLLFSFVLFSKKVEFIHSVEACYAGSLSIISCLAFLIFGKLLENQLNSCSIVSTSALHLSKKVRVLSLFCGTVFFLKSLILFLDVFVLHGTYGLALSSLFGLLICESIPIVVIDIILTTQLVLREESFSEHKGESTYASSYSEQINFMSSTMSAISDFEG